MTQLVRYEQARTALAECYRVDEVKDIRDKAEAMAAYARQAKDSELIQYATEIKVRAERRCGEISASMPSRQGRRDTSPNNAEKSKAHQLQEAGISTQQASRYEALAAMPAEHFETAVATAKATAGEVTTAFMLREASKSRPAKRLTKVAGARLEQLNQAKSTSVLVGHARMVLKAIRERGSLSDQEREVLGQLRTAIDRALAH